MIKSVFLSGLFLFVSGLFFAQNVMTPKLLIEHNRVSGLGLSADMSKVIVGVSKVDLKANAKSSRYYSIDMDGTNRTELQKADLGLADKHISPDGKYKIVVEEVQIDRINGADLYPEMEKSNMMVYNSLNYRHWDTWEDGRYQHILIEELATGKRTDIMKGEAFDCPQMPFGGDEDYVWAPDSKSVLYICKKKAGTAYAISTNTDIYRYNLETKQTENLTAENLGYDVSPVFSPKGQLSWLRMKRDGYESDKNDIIVRLGKEDFNVTKDWDGTVNSFSWNNDGERIYFTAAVQGTVHLFELSMRSLLAGKTKIAPKPIQMTKGQFDVRGIVGHKGNTMILARGDMNQATELYSLDLKTGEMTQITHENDAMYKALDLGKVEKRICKTVDGKDLHSWVIYPPNFDPTKKYPTLLYCQGGPQGALSQFYSVRWNFQLMAANGYIVIAPNRRGMPGYGVEWNEQISKDYGGLNMQDYLSAIDDLSKESYVDKGRRGCVGASYGGYSAFYLAAIHEGRFKSFIAHDGIFNWKSMYGTTEELFFVNFDIGGPYWDKNNKLAQKGYTEFNPVERVGDWTSPIMIIQGGKDFRVPIGQGLEAFQAAQLQGIKSRLLFFPEENHWVLDYQNSYIWHTEFTKWLKETL
jgi:dipeptidyl aminopeptidase/acylaminoacyl peptidase